MNLAGKWQRCMAAMRNMAGVGAQMAQVLSAQERLYRLTDTLVWQNLQSNLPIGHLAHGAFSVYSQNEEDGIIAEILRRIGPGNRTFMEIGVGDGMQCNTTHLLQQGWTGCWVEGDAAAADRISRTFNEALRRGQLRHVPAFITKENLAQLTGNETPDVLSIDIDGNDYWIWAALPSTPRVVVIEYNAGLGPELDWVMPYDPAARWDGSRYHGASLRALARLGRHKGYRLVGCNLTGVNAFFVHDACCGSAFLPAGDPREHYRAPVYSPDGSAGSGFRGHPPSTREFLADASINPPSDDA